MGAGVGAGLSQRTNEMIARKMWAGSLEGVLEEDRLRGV